MEMRGGQFISSAIFAGLATSNGCATQATVSPELIAEITAGIRAELTASNEAKSETKIETPGDNNKIETTTETGNWNLFSVVSDNPGATTGFGGTMSAVFATAWILRKRDAQKKIRRERKRGDLARSYSKAMAQFEDLLKRAGEDHKKIWKSFTEILVQQIEDDKLKPEHDEMYEFIAPRE